MADDDPSRKNVFIIPLLKMDVRAEKVNITLYIKNFEGPDFSFKSDFDSAV